MQWSEFANACEAAGIQVDKRSSIEESMYDVSPRQLDALKRDLPESLVGALGDWRGDTADVYQLVTGLSADWYDDGYGTVHVICEQTVSVAEYGPDRLAADGYPVMGLYQLPIKGEESWRTWVVDCDESRAYMAKNEGNPDLVKLL